MTASLSDEETYKILCTPEAQKELMKRLLKDKFPPECKIEECLPMWPVIKMAIWNICPFPILWPTPARWDAGLCYHLAMTVKEENIIFQVDINKPDTFSILPPIPLEDVKRLVNEIASEYSPKKE